MELIKSSRKLPCRFKLWPQSNVINHNMYLEIGVSPRQPLGTPIFKPWKWSKIWGKRPPPPLSEGWLRACIIYHKNRLNSFLSVETTQTYAADSTILMTMTYRPINNVCIYCIYLLHNALYCLHNVQRIMRLLVSYTSWFSLMHLYALRYCGVKASYWVILLGGEGALERICP